MENKTAITTCRIVAFMGILIGILLFAFGILVCSNAYGYGRNVSSYYKTYGSGYSYYTDSYEVMAASAYNTYEIVRIISIAAHGIGYSMIFGGLALMLGFTIKFASSFSVVKRKKVVSYIQQEEVSNEKNNDTKILIEYLKKSMEKENKSEY